MGDALEDLRLALWSNDINGSKDIAEAIDALIAARIKEAKCL